MFTPLPVGRGVNIYIPNAWFVIISGMGYAFFNHDLEKRIVQLVVGQLKQILRERRNLF